MGKFEIMAWKTLTKCNVFQNFKIWKLSKSPFVGKINAIYDGRQSLDLTKQQKNNNWPCIQIPRFSRVLIILIWIKVRNVLDASNFSKTQLRNSLKVLKHTFSSVKVKHFLSLKKTIILNLTRFWRAQVCARRAEIIFWKSSLSQLSLEKKLSQKLLWVMF